MKVCLCCGRVIEPRKKWKDNWEQVKFCSERCRRTGETDEYENEILEHLKARGRGKSICPSEVLALELCQQKQLMEKVRQAARRLVSKGKIVIIQNGRVVDPSTAKGPIRLKAVDGAF